MVYRSLLVFLLSDMASEKKATTMASLDATVKVQLDIDVNGEPITRLYSQSASMESLKDTPGGLVVHLHIDAAKLAEVLYPEFVKLTTQGAWRAR
jgi:hypothetical protein